MNKPFLVSALLVSLPPLLPAGCSEGDGAVPAADGQEITIFRDEWGVPHI
jgi:acyl-homoserine lactone acylase PvdQ